MSASGVLVNLEKVEAVMSWERPNVNLRGTKFLGIGWILQEIREWAEVVHSGQDCRISPTGHGLHGWGGPDHRESEIEDTWKTRDTDVSIKREDQLSPSLGKRQKTSASHEFQYQSQDWAISQAGQVICYFCRQPWHMRRDCS